MTSTAEEIAEISRKCHGVDPEVPKSLHTDILADRLYPELVEQLRKAAPHDWCYTYHCDDRNLADELIERLRKDGFSARHATCVSDSGIVFAGSTDIFVSWIHLR